MKRLISHVRPLFNIQLVHLFSDTFETARYNMIIHVIFFLVLFIIKKGTRMYKNSVLLRTIHCIKIKLLRPVDRLPTYTMHTYIFIIS